MSSLVEDKAVDLYVLERAFASTHPESEPLFGRVVEGYKRKMGQDWALIGRRLEEGERTLARARFFYLIDRKTSEIERT
jgi:tRNA A-37 threonylcarbamoyl transferase component Bud32